MSSLGNFNDRREEQFFDKQLSETKENILLEGAASADSEMVHLQRAKEREDLVRWQQDLTEDMVVLVHHLKRERFDPDTNRWAPVKSWAMDQNGQVVQVDAEPMCNDVCIQMIIALVQPFMSKNEIMSNYSEERILQKLRSTLKTLVRNLGIKHDYYEIDFHDMSAIRTTIQNYIMSGPHRALNNGERRHLESTTRRIETAGESQMRNARGRSFMGLFHS